jgi:hypothetical protein
VWVSKGLPRDRRISPPHPPDAYFVRESALVGVSDSSLPINRL